MASTINDADEEQLYSAPLRNSSHILLSTGVCAGSVLRAELRVATSHECVNVNMRATAAHSRHPVA